jgi:hypothetical protein
MPRSPGCVASRERRRQPQITSSGSESRRTILIRRPRNPHRPVQIRSGNAGNVSVFRRGIMCYGSQGGRVRG